MKPRAGALACVVALLVWGCGGTTIPEANKALRPVSLTASADVEAYEVADAVDDQLRIWCADAVAVREAGEPLAADDPIIDGRAAAEIERLRQAAGTAASPELNVSLDAFVVAHEERLAILRAGPKFAAKRYLRAERKVAELSFGLRRWRLQR